MGDSGNWSRLVQAWDLGECGALGPHASRVLFLFNQLDSLQK